MKKDGKKNKESRTKRRDRRRQQRDIKKIIAGEMEHAESNNYHVVVGFGGTKGVGKSEPAIRIKEITQHE